MAAKFRDTRVLPMEINAIAEKLRTIQFSGLHYNFLNETAFYNGCQMRMSHGVSFSSWGEDITITLTPRGNQTVVDILSECSMPTQIIDWGKNRENTSALFAYLMRQTGYQQPYSQSAQPYAQPQQPYSQPQQPVNAGQRFCPVCGNASSDQAVFCINCGAKLR